MSPLRGTLIGCITALLSFAALTLPTSSQRSVTASRAGAQTLLRNVPASCPITKPPEHPFIPPAPYSAKLNPRSFWFGTEKLWTSLDTDGTWNGLPHYTADDPTFRQKLFFWRAGFDGRSEPSAVPDHHRETPRRSGPAPRERPSQRRRTRARPALHGHRHQHPHSGLLGNHRPLSRRRINLRRPRHSRTLIPITPLRPVCGYTQSPWQNFRS